MTVQPGPRHVTRQPRPRPRLARACRGRQRVVGLMGQARQRAVRRLALPSQACKARGLAVCVCNARGQKRGRTHKSRPTPRRGSSQSEAEARQGGFGVAP